VRIQSIGGTRNQWMYQSSTQWKRTQHD